MVRLTIPSLFILIIQGFVIARLFQYKKWFRAVSIVLITLYLGIQVVAVPVHEESGLFLLESRIVRNVRLYIEEHKEIIDRYNGIYFIDTSTTLGDWGGSRKLADTLHGIDFIDHYFPGQHKVALYSFQSPRLPKNMYVIDAAIMFRQ